MHLKIPDHRLRMFQKLIKKIQLLTGNLSYSVCQIIADKMFENICVKVAFEAMFLNTLYVVQIRNKYYRANFIYDD